MSTRANMLLKNQSGTALVIALIMIIVMTLIGLASSYSSIFEIMVAGNKRGLTDAFYAADAGIDAITLYSTNFDLTNPDGSNKYTVLVQNTSSTYNPFGDPSIPNPTSAAGKITCFLTQSGPPRGTGFSAMNLGYTYYQIQSIGNDQLNSGSTATIQEEVVRLLPVQ
jgi:hypothetical protein